MPAMQTRELNSSVGVKEKCRRSVIQESPQSEMTRIANVTWALLVKQACFKYFTLHIDSLLEFSQQPVRRERHS